MLVSVGGEYRVSDMRARCAWSNEREWRSAAEQVTNCIGREAELAGIATAKTGKPDFHGVVVKQIPE